MKVYEITSQSTNYELNSYFLTSYFNNDVIFNDTITVTYIYNTFGQY